MPAFFKHDEPSYARQRPPWLVESLRESGLGEGSMPMFVIGDEASWDQPAAVVVAMPAGYVLFRHAHSCARLEVVIAGSLEVEDGVVLGPGDVMVAKPHEMYGPHTAGPDGCTTMEVFGALDGIFRVISDTPQGPVEVDVRTGQAPVGYEAV